jgi:ABC-type lipoprotein release transport system permease subunit
MLKKLGGLFFFFIIIVAAVGIANFLSLTFYEKSLLAVVKDFLFLLTRK